MNACIYIPHPALQEFVHSIGVVHAVVPPDAAPVICPYPPTPHTSLYFYVDDPISVKPEGAAQFIPQPRSVLVGPQLTRVTLNINRSHKAIRVDFKPGGLHRLLGMPMDRMLDGSYDASDVYGGEMRYIHDQLPEAGSFEAMKDLVETFLLQKRKVIKQALPFDRAMIELLRAGGNLSMDSLASLSCLSLRQFERVSKERIGYTPKLFARLVRFSNAYRMREKNPVASWTDIAHTCGYYDQMHFIRDFRAFAGVAPGVMEKELENTPVKLQAHLRI